jgi:hypothetical protein
MYGAQRIYREAVQKRRLWHFGLNPHQVGDFLAEYGWREVEQVGPAEYAARYVQPAGRDTSVSEIERAVYCRTLNGGGEPQRSPQWSRRKTACDRTAATRQSKQSLPRPGIDPPLYLKDEVAKRPHP